MVLQRALFLNQKVEIAISVLKDFEPEDGYYLGFSGGKDSLVLKALADLADVKYEAHFHRTTVDPPEVIRYIKAYHPGVIFDKPPMSMFALIVDRGIPPLRQMRYCCRVFKEEYGTGRIVLLGTRREESRARRDRQLVWFCSSRAKTVINAIVDWTSDEVWDFIYEQKLDYCCLYDEGFIKRIGCILCPCASAKTRGLEADRWPRFYKAYLKCFEKMLEKRRAMGKKTTWKTAQEVMDWWLSG